MSAAQPADASGPESSMVNRRIAAILLGTAVVRLALAGLTPLFPDETYYWEWSRRLATGYYDHPPLVAWLIRAGTLFFGDTPLGVRAGAVVAGIAGTWFVAATARRIAGDRAAILAAAIFAVMPLSAAGLVLATPDAGLLAFVAATIYCVVRAIESTAPRPALGWWALAGVAQGLAFWAKYTAILVPVGLTIALAARAAHRVQLKRPGPYVATVVATLVFLPVLLWNARHDWISFAFQIRHGLGAVGGSAMQREIELLGGQLGLVSPILFVMMLIALARAFAGPATSASSLLAPLSIFILAFFVYSATKRRAEANWPAIAYIPAVLVLLARARSVRWDRWLNAGIAVAASLTLITYVNSFTPILPVPAPRDPAARSAGWKELARAVTSLRDSIAGSRVPGSASRTFVGANRYQEASQLAFLMPDRPGTFSLNIQSRSNHYAYWPQFRDSAARGDALILALDEMATAPPAIVALTPHFADVQQRAPVVLARNGDPVRFLRLWELVGWRGTWPGAPVRSAP